VVKDGVELENLFDKAMTELETMQAEKVEGNLVNSALNERQPNTVAQIFYLKHNMKEKYGEDQQIEIKPSPLWFENREIKQLKE